MTSPPYRPIPGDTASEPRIAPRAGGGFRAHGTRRWLHLALFASTFLTVSFVGWLLEGADVDLTGWTGLMDAARGFLTLEAARLYLPYAVSLIAILGAHEMGHYLACRRYGIPASLPYFIPGPAFGTFGAVIRIRGRIPDRKALFDVAAAGPLAGLIFAVPVLILGALDATPITDGGEPGAGALMIGESLLSRAVWWIRGGEGGWEVGSLYVAGWFGLLVTSMNLFPVGQLDGGHLAYALSRRLHRWLSRITMIGLLAWVVTYTLARGTPSVYTLWCVVLWIMRDRHPPLIREHGRLGAARGVIAFVLLGVFVITFMPVPLELLESEGVSTDEIDPAVPVGPEDSNPPSDQSPNRVSMRMSEPVSPSRRYDRPVRTDRLEEVVARGVLRAVMTDEEHVRAHRLRALQDARLAGYSQISHHENRARATSRRSYEQGERAVILPQVAVGNGRVEYLGLESAHHT